MVFLNEDRLLSAKAFWKPAEEVGLITSGTGWGKTTFTFKTTAGLLETVNYKFKGNEIQPHEMYVIVPRASIKEEQLSKNWKTQLEDRDSVLHLHEVKNNDQMLEWQGEFEKQVRISTYQVFASIVRENPAFLDDVRLLVIDEYHMLYTDNTFIDTAEDVIHWVKTHMGKDRAIVGLTATPLPYFDVEEIVWEQYKEQFYIKHLILNDTVPPKYKPQEIKVISGSSIPTLVKEYATGARKVLACLQSKKTCYDEHFKNENRSWVITSKYGDEVYKKTGKTYAEMFNEDNYAYLLEHNGTPPHIDIVYITSALEVGFNIDDPAFQTVIIESYKPYQILQYFGRIRHDVQSLIIVPPIWAKAQLTKYKEFINKAVSIADNQTELFNIYKEIQEETENKLPPIVKYRDGRFFVNWVLLEELAYEERCYHAAYNYSEYKTITIGNKTLPNRREYFYDMLRGLGTPQYLHWERPRTEKSKNKQIIEHFNWTPWLDRWLTTQEYKECVRQLGVLNGKGEPYKTLSQPLTDELEECGYTVTKKKSHGYTAAYITKGGILKALLNNIDSLQNSPDYISNRTANDIENGGNLKAIPNIIDRLQNSPVSMQPHWEPGALAMDKFVEDMRQRNTEPPFMSAQDVCLAMNDYELPQDQLCILLLDLMKYTPEQIKLGWSYGFNLGNILKLAERKLDVKVDWQGKPHFSVAPIGSQATFAEAFK